MKVKNKGLIKRRKCLEQELSRIKKALIKLGANKIIWFGSFSRGVVGQTTDIDLLVVKDTKLSFMERLREVYNNIAPEVACDILVYTQKELDEMSTWSVFIRRALKEGKVIYAA